MHEVGLVLATVFLCDVRKTQTWICTTSVHGQTRVRVSLAMGHTRPWRVLGSIDWYPDTLALVRMGGLMYLVKT